MQDAAEPASSPVESVALPTKDAAPLNGHDVLSSAHASNGSSAGTARQVLDGHDSSRQEEEALAGNSVKMDKAAPTKDLEDLSRQKASLTPLTRVERHYQHLCVDKVWCNG